MSLFIHSDAATLACEHCAGEGEIAGPAECWQTSCTCGGRYHGMTGVICPECEGRGYRVCQTCKENPATGLDADNEDACAYCLAAEADEAREQQSRLRVLAVL